MNEHPLAFGAEIYEPTPREQTWKASGLSSSMAEETFLKPIIQQQQTLFHQNFLLPIYPINETPGL